MLKTNEIDYAKLFNEDVLYIKDKKLDADWAVWTRENTLYVRFEGTRSFKDTLIDLLSLSSSISAFDGANWKAHTGFKLAYYSVRNKVLDKCYELFKEDMDIVVLGHSLGGAMAILAAEDIGWHFKRKVTLITWGAPRTARDKKGINAIKEYLKSNSKNFENGLDIIPKLPWWFAKNPYPVHFGAQFSVLKAAWDFIACKFTYHYFSYGNSRYS